MQNSALKMERSPALGAGGHQRGASETAVMDRGRPTRKDEATFRRMQQTIAQGKPDKDHVEVYIPEGVCHSQAFDKIPIEELRAMRKRAKESAKKFKVLHESQVSLLSHVSTDHVDNKVAS
jgi:hypothetical protein